jgi:acyl-CoA-binding protein
MSANKDAPLTQFERAMFYMSKCTQQASTPAKTKLKLYAFFKRARRGVATGARPSVFSIEKRAKFDAWNAVKDETAEACQAKYIALVDQLNPTWQEWSGLPPLVAVADVQASAAASSTPAAAAASLSSSSSSSPSNEKTPAGVTGIQAKKVVKRAIDFAAVPSSSSSSTSTTALSPSLSSTTTVAPRRSLIDWLFAALRSPAALISLFFAVLYFIRRRRLQR